MPLRRPVELIAVPSPLAHAAVGLVALQTLRPSVRSESSAKAPRKPLLTAFFALVVVVLSVLPDLPSVIGLVTGNFGRFHNGPEHSILVGLVVGPILGLFLSRLGGGSALAWCLLATVCYELHVLMDYFTWGRGVRILWPWLPDRYAPPFPLFFGLHWSQGWISPRHLVTLFTEGLFVAALWGSTKWAKNRDILHG